MRRSVDRSMPEIDGQFQFAKGDGPMLRYFVPPIVVPIFILIIVVAGAYLRMH
jgi:hypothetical protein